MALNFPNSPSLNDEYTFGNKTWIWNGAAWKLKTDGAINDIPIGNSSPSTGGFTTLSATGTFTGTTVEAAQIGNSGATLTGTLDTAAQTNITSLGTLTGLTLSGTLTGTTVEAAQIGNSGATLTGTLSTAAQTNITSLGTLTGLTLSGTLTGTTINAATIGNSGASLVGSLTGDVTGTAAAATTVVTTVTGTSSNYYIPFSLSGATTGNASLGIDSGLYYNPSSNYLFTDRVYASLFVGSISGTSGTFSSYVSLSGDNDHIQFGLSADTRLFYDGVNNTFEMELEAAAQSFIITDNGTTRFTFEKSTGNLTAGNVSATAFTGDGSALTSIAGANVTGTVANATYADSAGSADTATTAGTAQYVTESSQPNITSVGSSLTTAEITIGSNAITSTHDTITIEPAAAGSTGNVVIEGNLRVTGNVTYIDSETITTNDLDIMVANNQTTSLGIDGAGIIAGNVSNVGIATFTYNHSTTSWQPNVGITPAANASLNLGGTSNYWNNGYFAAITAPSITGTLQTAAQTNITSVGTLTGLTLSGTLTGTTINAAAIGNTGATLTGTIQTAAQTNITSVGTLTGLTLSGSLNGTTIQAATIGNSGATLTGTLSTAAQTNITSVGTLTGLTLSGTLTGTTLEAATIGNSGATLTGTLSTAAQTNITSLGTLTGLTLSGTLTGTTVNAATIGNTDAAIVGATVSAATIGNSGATLTGTLSTAAQTNITSVGTLTALTLSGNISGTGSTFTGNVGANSFIINGDGIFWANGDPYSSGGSTAGGYFNSTLTSFPGSAGNSDYGSGETYVGENSSIDAFQIPLIPNYDMHDPRGSLETVDLGVLT